ncbi:MAG: hypothetical protein EP343_28995 [Deltaproteobacteria bacterium]|nr:MAG: hypothetical protein EP343_28995 [Deltaproteobacteria bacterium]
MKKVLLALMSVGALSLLLFATPAEAARCPKNCVSWFDGCNTCGCKNGQTTFCTRKACKRKLRPRCLKYAKPTLTCRNLRCRAPRRCRMISGKPRCLCPPVRKIRCKPGYVLAFKSVGGCRVAYCKRSKLSCRNVKCPKYRYCSMVSGKPRCLCRKMAIRCAPGYVTAYKRISGCRIPYCKKASCKRCPTNCSVWHDGCNDCRCVKGCITACTKRACVRRGKAYCKKR